MVADALSRPVGTDKGDDNNENIVMIPPHHIRTAITIEKPSNDFLRGIMTQVHDHVTAGHPGRDETLRKAQELYRWPRMKEWIADYVKGCAICQQNKILTH